MEENEATGGAVKTADEAADAGQEETKALEPVEGEEDLDGEFERLIKGRYREAYAKRAQTMIDRRFKEMKELEEFRDRVEKERGDGARRERAAAALGVAAEYEKLIRGAAGTKAAYPSFDVEAECRDKTFISLLASGLSVKSAYEALHHDEIVAERERAAADSVAEAARKGSAAAAARPGENGASHAAPTDPRRDVSALTGKDIRDIIRRVERGEKIKF